VIPMRISGDARERQGTAGTACGSSGPLGTALPPTRLPAYGPQAERGTNWGPTWRAVTCGISGDNRTAALADGPPSCEARHRPGEGDHPQVAHMGMGHLLHPRAAPDAGVA
jgi:hypothetical protein